MFRFIHAADLHLDSPLRGLERYEGAPVDALRSAARRAFENLVALAVEAEVAFVLLAGDLYDGDWKDYNTGLFLVAQVARLRQAGIPVYLVSGNHDAASVLTKHLQLPDNVHELSVREPETAMLEEPPVAIHGQGYPQREVVRDLTVGFPAAQPGRFNIGLLHTSLGGRPGHASYAPCTVAGLRALGYDYWALGHVHAREIVETDPWIVFPGNIQGRHAREAGAKGCTVVTVDDNRVVDVAAHDLDVVRWAVCAVDAAGATSAAAVVERVQERLREALDAASDRMLAARIVLDGACAAHAELIGRPEHWRGEIRAAALDLGGGRIWVEKIAVRTRGTLSADEVARRDDVLGGLVRAIRDLEADDARVLELAGLFDDLRSKLPGALTTGDDPLDLQDAATLRGAVEDAKELLMTRLLTEGDPG